MCFLGGGVWENVATFSFYKNIYNEKFVVVKIVLVQNILFT